MNENLANRVCPICLDNKYQILRNFSFIVPEGHPIANGYDLVCCDKCGFIFANVLASQNDYDIFYKDFSKYEDKKTSTGNGELLWEKTRFIQIVKTISDLLPNRNAKILDVGCANGGLLKAFQDLGYFNLHGIDPSEVCIRNSIGKGFSLSVGSLLSNKLPNQSYDCVILSHVMEHLLDLKSAVSSIQNLLRDDGLVYIEVPDANRYKDFIFSPFQDINTEHINHFSLGALQNLFADFQLVSIGEKNILSSPDMPYPAIYGVFKKSKINEGQLIINKDDNLFRNIQDYLIRSQKLIDDLDKQINEKLFFKGKPTCDIIVWGTGQLTMKLLTQTSLKNYNVLAFIDGNPINQGRMFANKNILSPQQVEQFPHETPILISTILHQSEIVESINLLNLSNPIVVFDIE